MGTQHTNDNGPPALVQCACANNPAAQQQQQRERKTENGREREREGVSGGHVVRPVPATRAMRACVCVCAKIMLHACIISKLDAIRTRPLGGGAHCSQTHTHTNSERTVQRLQDALFAASEVCVICLGYYYRPFRVRVPLGSAQREFVACVRIYMRTWRTEICM